MASGYSSETQCSTYIVQRLYYSTTADSTGHNVYVELQMRRTNSYGGDTFQYPSSSNISIDGNNQTWNWDQNSYPVIPAYNTDWVTFASRTVHVNHTAAKGINISGGNSNMGSYLTGSSSVDITLEAIQTAPNTPSVSASVTSDDALSVTWGTSSFGNPSSGTVYLYGGTSASPTTQLTSKTTTGDSTSSRTGLAANTKYYYRSRAKNTADLWSSYSSDATATTKAAAPTITAGTATHNSIELNYSQSADGGADTKYVEYSLDGNTWVTGATLTGGAAATGTFTITGLSPATTYSIQTRTRTASGSSAGPTLSVTTARDVKLYGSVNDQTEEVQKLYGPVNGQTKLIKKLYGSVNGLTKLIYRG